MEPFAAIQEYLTKSIEEQGNAPMCLSTINENGFPNSRFVDLKSVIDNELLFGTDSRSTKAQEFIKINRVSACIWNKNQAIQIRIIGTIKVADENISDKIFETRNETAKAIANVSIQSQELNNMKELELQIAEFVEYSKGKMKRPNTWWIYRIIPKEIEILKFLENRIHLRTLYWNKDNIWQSKLLNP